MENWNKQLKIKQSKTLENLYNLESLLDKFLNYLEFEKNNSPKTLENYSLWLNRFVSYIWNVDVRDIKAMHILDYRMYLNQLGLSKKNCKLSCCGT